MSFIPENPALVAPRPVRITTVAQHHLPRSHSVRLFSPPADRIAGHSPDVDDSRSLADDSPHASPRSALPSEALEEFLSILRPSVSIFPPNIPRRRAPNTVASWPYERSKINIRSWARIEAAPTKSDVDDSDAARSSQPSRNALSSNPATPEIDASLEMEPFIYSEPTPFRWFSSGILASPVSRNHTRNPFFRHVTAQSPAPVMPLSPAAIPLPTPSPDELLDLR